MFQEFSKKWGLKEPTVLSIYRVIQDCAGQCGRAHKILKSFEIRLSTRQLRYFYKKVKLTERYGDKDEIGSKNYHNLVTSKS